MIIQPKSRGFICLTAHPHGCHKNVEDMVNAAMRLQPKNGQGPKNVVVIGASSGYGLASRIVAAFTYKAKTIGVSLEKEASGNRTATAGYYNNRAFGNLAQQHGIPCQTINGDAYSNETKQQVISASMDLFQGEKIDLLVYSLAAPKRIHPDTQETYVSVIKPIGQAYRNKTVDFHTGNVTDVTIEPASEKEIGDTVKVMGGEDWQMWIDRLNGNGLLAEGFITLAYSYIGPPLTHAIYKNGTIGKAKDDLAAHCKSINTALKPLRGNAYISVNKALVTQASSAIPVVPLYISMLYKIMKQKGLHEGCLEQMERMFTDRVYSGNADFADAENRIRMDDYEMRPDVQKEIDALWPMVNSENIQSLTDIQGYRDEFFALFGFGRGDIDYEADVSDY